MAASSGIILAGGDGLRLRGLTRALAGDERPKQFCRLLGSETLLEQTQRRARLLIEPEQLLTVVTRTHERFYRHELAAAPPHTVIAQPDNRGTAPAILLALLRLEAVAHPATLTGLVRRAVPALADAFAPVRTRIGTAWEDEAVRTAYAGLALADFSRDVLQRSASHLAVLPVSGLEWNDLGDPGRVLATRQRMPSALVPA